ncbi:CPBP family glutamic-type intramembrane protease [Prolixibacter denitrificans]|uniref:CAAX prenyl protease-like protein n=1 Tax=Prolixibacter denitrificans TaxID=1541063 RepID=A0A2P8C688_9BACT|nr:CPBP family glutamic-type intramembrane protease [Prolixibacter denitrificans]PSK80471.1 CAAX prenyl protease-like protein [Prolixibacter denitrificans]GET22751.1 hypothetical protein JCM18694_29970 [Prolixibacter denitrificans]
MLGEFFRYLKHPRFIRTEPFEPRYFFKFFIRVFFWAILLVIPRGIIGLFYTLKAVRPADGYWGLFAFFVIIAPIVEETLFRLWLRPQKKNFIFFSGISAVVSINELVEARYLNAGILMVLTCISLLFIYQVRYRKLLQRWILRHFGLLFYISFISFGLLHINNIRPLPAPVLLLAPLITLPQIFTGGALGYIRMKYGIVYSMLLHSIFNLTVFLLFGWLV